jgi:hypothetical protein
VRGPGTAASIPEKFAFEAALVDALVVFSHVDIAVVATKAEAYMDLSYDGITLRIHRCKNGRVPNADEIARLAFKHFGVR